MTERKIIERFDIIEEQKDLCLAHEEYAKALFGDIPEWDLSFEGNPAYFHPNWRYQIIMITADRRKEKFRLEHPELL